jgi:hypothetical protein
MPAFATLASTTLAEGCDGASTRIKLTSTTGLTGTVSRIWCGGELMKFERVDISPWVIVRRGVDGSKASPHASGEAIYIGQADQFFYGPPAGRPDATVLVSPYIDVVNGNVYFAQGDTTPTATANRWWQIQTTTRTSGPLGVQTSTLDPTSST